MHYDQLKMAGQDNIMLLLKSYPPLWQIIAPSEFRVKEMLEMFLKYDEITKENEEEGDEDEDEDGDDSHTPNDRGTPNAAA